MWPLWPERRGCRMRRPDDSSCLRLHRRTVPRVVAESPALGVGERNVDQDTPPLPCRNLVRGCSLWARGDVNMRLAEQGTASSARTMSGANQRASGSDAGQAWGPGDGCPFVVRGLLLWPRRSWVQASGRA